jgi:hypothetical protein
MLELLNKFKAKADPLHAMEALGGDRKYSSYLYSTSALDGGEWSASRTGRALAPGKGPPEPVVQEAGLAPEPVWTQRLQEKSFRLCRVSNFDLPVVQSVVRHYTAWDTLLTLMNFKKSKYNHTNLTILVCSPESDFCEWH